MNKRHGQYTMYPIDTWCVILTMYYPHTPRYAAWVEPECGTFPSRGSGTMPRHVRFG
jgi:hypothetical protein